MMGYMMIAHRRKSILVACTIIIITLLLLALLSLLAGRSSSAAFNTASNRLKVGEKSGYDPQDTDRKPELLYVLDSNLDRANSQILLIDSQSGNTLRSFKAHGAPDFTLSKDGSRLYIDSSLEGAEGVLDVVDTA